MKCRRISLEADVRQYKLNEGMEDGFAPWTEIVTQGWIITDFLIKITREDGTIVCPYIKNRRGYTFIGEGDYIVTDSDGTKHVCGADKIWNRYEEI